MNSSSVALKFKSFFSSCKTAGEKHSKYKPVLGLICDILIGLVFLVSISLEAVKPFNYIAIILFALFCVFALIYVLFYGEFFFDIYLALILIFLLTQYIATIVNLFPSFTKTGTLMVGMSFVIYYYVKQKDVNKKRILYLFIASALIFLLLFAIKYRYEIFHPNFSDRIGTFFGNQNDVARHFSFCAILFLIFVCLNKKTILKIIGYLLFLITFYFIFLTGSISNALVLSIVLFIHIYMSYTKTTKSKIACVCGILCFVSLMFIIIFTVPGLSYFKERIINMISSFFGKSTSFNQRDRSSEFRFTAALYGFRIFFQNPFFGNGYNAVYRFYFMTSHNNIAEVAANFGIIALIVEEIILFFPLFKCKKRDQKVFLLMIYIVMFQLFLVSFNAKVENILVPFCYSFIDNDNLRIPNLRTNVIRKEVNI